MFTFTFHLPLLLLSFELIKDPTESVAIQPSRMQESDFFHFPVSVQTSFFGGKMYLLSFSINNFHLHHFLTHQKPTESLAIQPLRVQESFHFHFLLFVTLQFSSSSNNRVSFLSDHLDGKKFLSLSICHFHL